MRIGVLFSGGKDSTYACYLAKKAGYEVSCLITIMSNNPESFMFHTPAIGLARKQAELMSLPIIVKKTKGEKEKELNDLKNAIKIAVKKYKIECIVTGAVASNYQASRIQKICDELKIKCFTPLWHKDQIKLLEELLENKFEVILSGVFAYPFDKNLVGEKIDKNLIKNLEKLKNQYSVNPAGEGGEFESLVLNCPLFANRLNVKLKKTIGEGNSWRGIFEQAK